MLTKCEKCGVDTLTKCEKCGATFAPQCPACSEQLLLCYDGIVRCAKCWDEEIDEIVWRSGC